MSLTRFYVQGFRSLNLVDVELCSGLNVFYGVNGAGKTSLLEALHILGSGRSFLTHKPQDIIRHNEEHYIVSGRLQHINKETQIGIKRDKQKMLIKVNAEPIDKISVLARHLPFQIIHPESHALISGGPKLRRQFIDWGVFHVEHSFNATWLRYQRALKQRNAVMRQRIHSMEDAYNQELSQTAALINQARLNYLDLLQPQLIQFMQQLLPNNELSTHYYAGWDTEFSLNELLKKNQKRDWQKGFTSDGPHKADLKIKMNGYRADAEISRGQQKILVLVFRLAQMSLYQQITNQPCLVMIDDLASELDVNHRQTLLKILQNMNLQTIISCIDESLLDFSDWDNKKMFHVEHGQVNPVL